MPPSDPNMLPLAGSLQKALCRAGWKAQNTALASGATELRVVQEGL